MGYRVHAVENGRLAVDWLKNNRVDLVLLDMIMEPDFDGLDTFRAIRRINSDQKVLIVSGFSATARVNEMITSGAGGYIKKPYTRLAIGAAVREELDRKDDQVSPPPIRR